MIILIGGQKIKNSLMSYFLFERREVMITLLLIFICILSTLGFIVCSGIYITCLGISRILEEVIIREKRKSVNKSNKELSKD